MNPNPRNEPRMYRDVFTPDMPLSFGHSLTQNPDALERFARLDDKEKRAIIANVHDIRTAEEMRAFIENFAGDTMGWNF